MNKVRAYFGLNSLAVIGLARDSNSHWSDVEVSYIKVSTNCIIRNAILRHLLMQIAHSCMVL